LSLHRRRRGRLCCWLPWIRHALGWRARAPSPQPDPTQPCGDHGQAAETHPYVAESNHQVVDEQGWIQTALHMLRVLHWDALHAYYIK
jgi:hypothetical protein